MKRALSAATCLLAATLAGCATTPVNYAASLSPQDPKWQSPQCQQARLDAQNYDAREKEHPGWGMGMLLGPYGLGIVSAIKEHEQKERKALAREIHTQCSSLPLPKELQANAPSKDGHVKYP